VVPVIDLSAPVYDVVSEVAEACERIGFLIVTGHGVPAPIVDEMHAVTADFFARPFEEKIAWEGADEYIGFVRIGRSRYREASAPNLVEEFHVNRFDSYDVALGARLQPIAAAAQAANIWPNPPVRFQPAWNAYYLEMERLTARMASIFARGLGLPPDWFEPLLRLHVSPLAANWYPPQAEDPCPGQVRNSTHVDFSLFTILYQDRAPGGLEVRDRSGTWRAVPAVPGSFVINLGDVMNRLTNDRWRATFHRVVNPPPSARGRGRISLPYFVTPDPDAVIEPVLTCLADRQPPYPPVRAGDYADDRRNGRRAETMV
jgi:isopenicillin N synthase-like dioxygenase